MNVHVKRTQRKHMDLTSLNLQGQKIPGHLGSELLKISLTSQTRIVRVCEHLTTDPIRGGQLFWSLWEVKTDTVDTNLALRGLK